LNKGDLPPLFDMTPEQRDQLIEAVAQKIMQFGMATPAILFLEAHKPLGRLAGNALHLFSPVLGTFVPTIDHYGVLLQDRENIEILISRLQEMEEERVRQERILRQERKARARARKMKILGFDPDEEVKAEASDDGAPETGEPGDRTGRGKPGDPDEPGNTSEPGDRGEGRKI